MKGGFLKVYSWVIDDLGSDCKTCGLYLYLLSKVYDSKKTYYYKVDDRSYRVLSGQYITSYRRLREYFKVRHDSIKSMLKKLESIHAIKIDCLDFNHPSGKPGSDGIKITCMTPVTNVNYPYNIGYRPPVTSVNDTRLRMLPQFYTCLKSRSLYLERETYVDVSKNNTANNSGLDLNDQGGLFKTTDDTAENQEMGDSIVDRGVGNGNTPSDLLALWNRYSGVLPKCRVLSDKRKRQCKLRLKENPDMIYWQTVIEKLAKSKFAVEGKWASFDWIIKNQENPDKAFNGNYDDKDNSSTVKSDLKFEDLL